MARACCGAAGLCAGAAMPVRSPDAAVRSIYEQSGGTYHEDERECLIPDSAMLEEEMVHIGLWGNGTFESGEIRPAMDYFQH